MAGTTMMNLLCLVALILFSLRHARASSYDLLSPGYVDHFASTRDDVGQQSRKLVERGYTCPGDNGTSFISTGGDTYYTNCSTSINGDHLADTGVASLLQCANFCTVYNSENPTTEQCQYALRYVSGGHCYLIGGGGALTNSTETDVAELTEVASPPAEPPTQAFAPTCPTGDNTFYTISTNDTYAVRCNTQLHGAGLGTTYGTNFPECMAFNSQYNIDNTGTAAMAVVRAHQQKGLCQIKGTKGPLSYTTFFDTFVLSNNFPNCNANSDNASFYQGLTDGRRFQTYCGAAASGYSVLGSASYASDIACINACDAIAACIVATSVNGGKTCTFGGASTGPYTFIASDGSNAFFTNATALPPSSTTPSSSIDSSTSVMSSPSSSTSAMSSPSSSSSPSSDTSSFSMTSFFSSSSLAFSSSLSPILSTPSV